MSEKSIKITVDAGLQAYCKRNEFSISVVRSTKDENGKKVGNDMAWILGTPDDIKEGYDISGTYHNEYAVFHEKRSNQLSEGDKVEVKKTVNADLGDKFEISQKGVLAKKGNDEDGTFITLENKYEKVDPGKMGVASRGSKTRKPIGLCVIELDYDTPVMVKPVDELIIAFTSDWHEVGGVVATAFS